MALHQWPLMHLSMTYLCRELSAYSEFSVDVSNAASTSFKHHLWYLGPDLIGLSFKDHLWLLGPDLIGLALFAEKVSSATKLKMFEAAKARGKGVHKTNPRKHE